VAGPTAALVGSQSDGRHDDEASISFAPPTATGQSAVLRNASKVARLLFRQTLQQACWVAELRSIMIIQIDRR
jgi:hypothetical protein